MFAIYFVWLRGFRWCFLIYWCWIPNAQQSNIHCFIRQNDIFVHSIYLCLARIICEAKEKRLKKKQFPSIQSEFRWDFSVVYNIHIVEIFVCAQWLFKRVSFNGYFVWFDFTSAYICRLSSFHRNHLYRHFSRKHARILTTYYNDHSQNIVRIHFYCYCFQYFLFVSWLVCKYADISIDSFLVYIHFSRLVIAVDGFPSLNIFYALVLWICIIFL